MADLTVNGVPPREETLCPAAKRKQSYVIAAGKSTNF